MQVALRVIHFKYLLKLIVGLIIGLLTGLYLTIYFCNDGLKQQHKSVAKETNNDELRAAVLSQQANITVFTNTKLNRTRYAATELNIKYKLFIGVLTYSQDLTPVSWFMNKSLIEHANKVVYFVNNPTINDDSFDINANIVQLNNNNNLFDLKSFKYALDNYLDQYEWFFFVTDNTFVRGSKLNDLLTHISFTKEFYIGYSSDDQHPCSLKSGVLFSYSLLQNIYANLNLCFDNLNPQLNNIGDCVKKINGLTCSQTLNGDLVSFYAENNFDYDRSIGSLIAAQNFNNSITVTSASDIITLQKLKYYFNQVEMKEIENKIVDIEKNIMEIAALTPEGYDSLYWPISLPKPLKPISRYEVIEWQYFNLTHHYFGSDFEVIEPMNEYYKQDVDEIIDFSMQNLNSNNQTRYQFKNILNGYKQFDPTRGATYILDLILLDTLNSNEIIKRVNLMRPLGEIEITRVNNNQTEFAKINLIITFSENNKLTDISNFFNTFEKFLNHLNIPKYFDSLLFAYITSNASAPHENYELIDIKFKNFKSKLPLNMQLSRIVFYDLSMYHSDDYRQILVIDHFSPMVPESGLVLMIPSCAQINLEFLERVSLNTFRSEQVFFPIPFNGFMPEILKMLDSNAPNKIDIKRDSGFFNQYSYEFAAFYNEDFIKIRQASIGYYTKSLFDMFKENSNLEILRAPDKDLKCTWRLVDNCDKQKMSTDEKNRCFKQRENNLGTSSQLFKILINS